MESRSSFPISERRKRERRVWRAGLALSVLFHLLVYVFWPSGEFQVSPYAAAGPRSGSPRAAAGGMQAMNVRTPEPRPITPPPVPLPSLEPVEVEFEPEPATDAARVLGERPGSEGPGLDEGEGAGDGGTAEEGRFRLVPPSPRGMIMPPSSDDLKGTEVQVWVFVDERGRVVPDSTRLRPPTDDRAFNRRLIEEAAQWVFEPARQGGEPVAAWFPYTISM